MRMSAGLMISAWIGLLACTAATGQAAGAPPPPVAPAPVPPAPVPRAGSPEIESQVIPGDQISSISLQDLLNLLKDTVPGFNSVIVRDPEVVPDYPTLPAMTLKNVTVGQLLELIKTSFAGVEISRIDGPTAPLYLIRILPREGVPTQAQAAQAAAMKAAQPNQAGLAGQFNPNPIVPGFDPASGGPDAPQVKVYRLDDIVRSLTTAESDPASRKKALDDVLSLIQAALDQTGGSDSVVLKVHEPTQTIIFKGSYRKMLVLEQVLETLRPKPNEPGTVEALLRRQRDIEDMVRQIQSRIGKTTGTSTTRP